MRDLSSNLCRKDSCHEELSSDIGKKTHAIRYLSSNLAYVKKTHSIKDLCSYIM